MYGCGCRGLLGLLICKLAKQIEQLVQLEDFPWKSGAIAMLHENCEEKSVERFIWRRVECKACLGVGGLRRRLGGQLLADVCDGDEDSGDGRRRRSGRTRKAKERAYESESGEDEDDEGMSRDGWDGNDDSCEDEQEGYDDDGDDEDDEDEDVDEDEGDKEEQEEEGYDSSSSSSSSSSDQPPSTIFRSRSTRGAITPRRPSTKNTHPQLPRYLYHLPAAILCQPPKRQLETVHARTAIAAGHP